MAHEDMSKAIFSRAPTGWILLQHIFSLPHIPSVRQRCKGTQDGCLLTILQAPASDTVLTPVGVGQSLETLPGLAHGPSKLTTWTQLEQTRFRLRGKFSVAPNIEPAPFGCLLLRALKEGVDRAEEPAFAFVGEERKKLSDRASVRFGVSTVFSTKLEHSP